MRLLKRTVTAVVLVVAAPGLLWAQVPETPTNPDNPVQVAGENTGYGTVSGEFLQFGGSARGMALGGAYSTIADLSLIHISEPTRPKR